MLRDEFAKAQVYVARDLGVFAGFLMIRPPGAAWEITLIAVHPAFRGRGVVEALVAALTASSTAGSGAAEIQLEVRADNEFAIRAYERMGFRAVGRRRGYYQDGVDAVLYSRN